MKIFWNATIGSEEADGVVVANAIVGLCKWVLLTKEIGTDVDKLHRGLLNDRVSAESDVLLINKDQGRQQEYREYADEYW